MSSHPRDYWKSSCHDLQDTNRRQCGRSINTMSLSPLVVPIPFVSSWFGTCLRLFRSTRITVIPMSILNDYPILSPINFHGLDGITHSLIVILYFLTVSTQESEHNLEDTSAGSSGSVILAIKA
ncbi:hypothetical protein OSB04_001588 [Centaurea solstitialis]|uniref:Uncharacterized protein n=1 Tax=Centaurea solstitialis TaxID=347529 RepID=A0AA38WLJ9_9ASTR|nr:hypothetical protein OSB04_001588 [Centaurea solstitialis]